VGGEALTSARKISRDVFKMPGKAHKFCTLMLAQWAQFIYEDIARVGTNQLFKGNHFLKLCELYLILL
jgi:hypothetical protein